MQPSCGGRRPARDPAGQCCPVLQGRETALVKPAGKLLRRPGARQHLDGGLNRAAGNGTDLPFFTAACRSGGATGRVSGRSAGASLPGTRRTGDDVESGVPRRRGGGAWRSWGFLCCCGWLVRITVVHGARWRAIGFRAPAEPEYLAGPQEMGVVADDVPVGPVEPGPVQGDVDVGGVGSQPGRGQAPQRIP